MSVSERSEGNYRHHKRERVSQRVRRTMCERGRVRETTIVRERGTV